MNAALDGVKVADFSWVGVGPMTAKYLADHGATVVRIESKLRPDTMRTTAPFEEGKKGINRSGYFAFFNTNKYSITINLNSERGREVAKRLIKWADVVIESFTPGQMEKWGLGYEDVRRINPGAIMARISAHGLTGPYGHHIGFGHQLVGLSGFVSGTGWPDRGVVPPYGAYTDWTTPRLIVSALVAALDYRNRTGKGQCLDCSQVEAALSYLAPYLLDYDVSGRIAEKMGNQSPCAAPHAVYPCRGEDRWCAISVFSDQEWESLVKVMANPEWAKDPRFATLHKRKENEEELNNLMGAWTAKFDARELMELLQSSGIAAGVVEDARDLYQDPQLRHRHILWEMDHPEMGKFSHLGQTFSLSKTPARPYRPAPCLGEHTYFVCTEILGMSQDEFVELLNSGSLE